MATDLSEDAVLRFLRSSGGSVKNSELLLHFRTFLQNHADRDRNREHFKRFVNSVAVVKQVDGASYIVLKKKYSSYDPGNSGGRGSSGPLRVPAGKITEPSPQRTNLIPGVSAEKSRLKPQQREAGTPAPLGEAARRTVLPAAGIVMNIETNIQQKQQQSNSSAETSDRRTATHIRERTEVKATRLSEAPAQAQRTKGGQQRMDSGPSPGITPVAPAVRLVPGPQPLKGGEARLHSGGALHQEPPLHLHQSEVAPRRIRHRPSYKTAVSCDDDEEEEELLLRRSSGGTKWPMSGPVRDISPSSSYIIDRPVPPSSSERKPPKIFIQDVPGETLGPRGPGWSTQSGLELRGPQAGTVVDPVSLSGESTLTRRSLPLDAERHTPSTDPRSLHDVHQDRQYSQPAGVQQEPVQGPHQNQRVQPLSSHSSILSTSSGFSSGDWPLSGSSTGSGSSKSFEDLQSKTAVWTGETGHDVQIQEPLHRDPRTKLDSVTHLEDSMTTSSPWPHSTDKLHDDEESPVRALHLSTGHLLDNHEETELSDGPASPPVLRLRSAISRRLSREVRNRMCRSLGTDLDQIHQEHARGGGGNETARLNRLHLISSSLSLRTNLSTSSLSSCATPPRCQSLDELDEGTDHKRARRSLPASSTTHHQGPGKQSLVPLEPREHDWFVKAAAGTWPEIYSMFREDPSLLNKPDFIFGFTVLHWIAKHGDHKVLNTLWYGVQKATLTFNVNARSKCGHTPLHIAAIHGKKSIIRLLIKRFSADVKLRDIAGKRPWQYLSCTMTPDVFQLLGAPARAALGNVNTLEQRQEQQPRRLRHNFSTASGERPLNIVVTSKVKRSTSLAAILKHKSMHPFHAKQSETSI